MRVVLASLVLMCSLSACALPSPGSGPSRYEPLRAYVTPPSATGLGFHVNRPAYVAMFEVVPGRGTSLVYPAPGAGRMNGFVFSGIHNLGSLRRHNADQYLPTPAAFASYGGGPRFFFLVASEQPLDLGQFGAYGMGLRSALGMQFASINAYHTMEALATEVLPTSAPEGSWTSDLYVHWPQVLYDSRAGSRGLVPLRCNGYSAYVPLETLLAVREALCASRAPDSPQPQPQPGDSAGGTGIVKPRAREPLPRRQAEELRERIASSNQLEETPAARRPYRGAATSDADRVERTRATERAGDEPRARSRPPSAAPRSDRGRPASRGTTEVEPRGSSGARAQPQARPSAPSGGARTPAARPTPRSGGGSPRAGGSSIPR